MTSFDDPFGRDIAEALGLNPEDVTSIILSFRAGHRPAARIALLLPDDRGKLVETTRLYELTERTSPAELT